MTVTVSMMRAWIEPAVLEVTIGVGLLSVDLIAGKEPSMRAETVRCLHGLISKADMDWLPDRTEKR